MSDKPQARSLKAKRVAGAGLMGAALLFLASLVQPAAALYAWWGARPQGGGYFESGNFY